MACDLKTILDSACANDFVQLAATDPKQARAVILQLLCNISAGGGSSGIAQSFAGSGPPTTQVPANSAGTYYDYTNQNLYVWNPILPGWILYGPSTFTSGLFDLADVDNDIIIPHGLGVIPKFVRVVTVCVNGPAEGDLGYATGTEIDALCWTLGDATYQPTFTIGVDATNIQVHECNFHNASPGIMRLNTANSQDVNSWDFVTNWKLKAYAKSF